MKLLFGLLLLIFALSFFAAPVHAESLYDKFDSWQEFYNSAVDGVFSKYPPLKAIAQLQPPLTAEINVDSETVYLGIVKGRIKTVSESGSGKIEINTTTEVLDSLLSSKTFPQIRTRFYDNYDAGKITIKARGHREKAVVVLALWAGRHL